MIRVANVSKEYCHDGGNKLLVLNDISFEINKGEFAAIVGRSGSGKSTLMHIISGLAKPTYGDVYISGENINKFNDSSLAAFRNKFIGFIFQAYYLEHSYSAIDNVTLPLIAAGMSKSKREVMGKELLERFGLSLRMSHRPNQLSGGECQRVCIARALINDPQIIFADEPTGNLDTANGEIIMDILVDLAKMGKTIVLVTHNESDAKIADKLIRLEDGKLII